MCSSESNWKHAIIGSNKDLAPNKWQVFILTYAGLVYWGIYASHDLNELSFLSLR